MSNNTNVDVVKLFQEFINDPNLSSEERSKLLVACARVATVKPAKKVSINIDAEKVKAAAKTTVRTAGVVAKGAANVSLTVVGGALGLGAGILTGAAGFVRGVRDGLNKR